MFERYTQRARRVIFFSRYEASQFGSDFIEPHHLLLGILRENRELALRLLNSTKAPDTVRAELESRFPRKEKVPTSVDIPLSHESKRALAYAAEEAERLEQTKIGTGHLLLGLLREEGCAAAEVLRGHGLQLSQAREEVARSPERESSFTREELHRLIDELSEDSLEKAGLALETLRYGMAPSPTAWTGSLSTGASAYSGPHSIRFTEKVRRVLFFARYEASQLGSETIEPEHLLLGLLREDKILANRFVGSYAVIEQIRKEVEQRSPPKVKISTLIDLPLGEASLRVLDFSGQESNQLGHKHVGTEHVLLGLLREENSLAAEVLTKRGGQLEKVRAELSRREQR